MKRPYSYRFDYKFSEACKLLGVELDASSVKNYCIHNVGHINSGQWAKSIDEWIEGFILLDDPYVMTFFSPYPDEPDATDPALLKAANQVMVRLVGYINKSEPYYAPLATLFESIITKLDAQISEHSHTESKSGATSTGYSKTATSEYPDSATFEDFPDGTENLSDGSETKSGGTDMRDGTTDTTSERDTRYPIDKFEAAAKSLRQLGHEWYQGYYNENAIMRAEGTYE